MAKILCIYSITNLKDGSRYIGSAIDFERRRYHHRYHLERGTHDNRHLQSAWNRDGGDNFGFGIVTVLHRPGDLIPFEQIWIDEFMPEYNISKTAGNTLGCKRSEDAKQRIGKAHTGNKYCVGREMSQ